MVVWKTQLRSIYLEYFLALAKHIIQELIIRLPSLVVNIIFFYKFFFFPSIVIEQSNLKIRNSKIFSSFKKSILKFLRPSSNSVFKCHSPKGIKLITRLRLGLSHLREHKFRHNFQDTLNPVCSCGDDIETTVHYLLHYPNYFDERRTLLDNFQSIGENISNNDASNTCILNATIQYILATKDLMSLLLALESFE